MGLCMQKNEAVKLKISKACRDVSISNQQNNLKTVSDNSLAGQNKLKELLKDLQSPFEIKQNYDLAPEVIAGLLCWKLAKLNHLGKLPRKKVSTTATSAEWLT